MQEPYHKIQLVSSGIFTQNAGPVDLQGNGKLAVVANAAPDSISNYLDHVSCKKLLSRLRRHA